MVQALLALKACLESSEIERRLDEIEALVANRLIADKTSTFRPKIVS